MAITQEELQQLRAPFPISAHTAREGHKSKNGKKIRWFVYVERNEVQDRLEEIFPGEWGTERPELHIQANKVSAVVGITIRGTTRWDGGEDDSNEGTKGALTNAFRRTAAYGWHVGRYLYDMDVDIWTESYDSGDWDAMKARKQDAIKQFEAWYNRQFKATPPPPKPAVIPTPQPPAATTVSTTAGNAGNAPANGNTGAPDTDVELINKIGYAKPNWTVIYSKVKPLYDNGEHMANSVSKMFREGAFANCKDDTQVIAVVTDHKKAG